MTIPTTYTETTLAQYMHSELGKVVSVLGYAAPTSTAGVYQEQVNDVMLDLHVDDLETAPDIRKVRALARMYAWQKATNDLTTKFDFSEGGDSFSSSQMVANAQKALGRAEMDCMSLGVVAGFTVSVTSVDSKQDPYSYPRNVEGV